MVSKRSLWAPSRRVSGRNRGGRSLSDHEVLGEAFSANTARFRVYGIEISFEDEASHDGGSGARKSGARGLLTVWEKLFRVTKFSAGSGLRQLRVSAELVREPTKVLDAKAEGHKRRRPRWKKSAPVFPSSFNRRMDWRLFSILQPSPVSSSAPTLSA